MGSQGQRVALWLVAVLGVVLGGAALVVSLTGRPADLVTKAQLDTRVGTVEAAVVQRIAELTAADGATPIVNAAQLNGLTADQFARAEAGGTHYFSCQGIGMWPWSSETKYTQTKQGRQVTEGEGFFDCFVYLPDGATITALRALVHDLSPTKEVLCYMIAAPINLVTTGNSPAYTESSGDEATPGDTIIEDLSIEPAVVDNTNHSYLVECWISGPGDLALKGVSVEYRLGAAPAAQ